MLTNKWMMLNVLQSISHIIWKKWAKKLLPLLMTKIMCRTWQTLEFLQCIRRFLQFDEELVQIIIRQLVSFLSTPTHCCITAILSPCAIKKPCIYFSLFIYLCKCNVQCNIQYLGQPSHHLMSSVTFAASFCHQQAIITHPNIKQYPSVQLTPVRGELSLLPNTNEPVATTCLGALITRLRFVTFHAVPNSPEIPEGLPVCTDNIPYQSLRSTTIKIHTT